VKVFVGVPSYNRAKVLRPCLSSFSNSKLVRGFIVVADSTSKGEAEHYAKVVKEITNAGFEILHDISVGRRGSVRARNRVLEMAKEHLSDDDVLVLYDDDYLYPGDHALTRALSLLRDASIGIVGGRVVNLRRRRVDPDFALNVPRLADTLTRLTGFIVLNTKHGPREVDFTTHLMAMKIRVLNRGIKYDESYRGIGYREESDLQRQVRDLGLKIVFEPRFYAYHLAVEEGGDRYSDLEDRMYWKWRNHAYFMNKWRYPAHKKMLSYAILMAYALLNGPSAVRGMMKAVRGKT
jgi:GT2 family glycosyltransferase